MIGQGGGGRGRVCAHVHLCVAFIPHGVLGASSICSLVSVNNSEKNNT